MRFVLLALFTGIALGQTPAPVVPTEYPTLTPGPSSACTYVDDDLGPFALDCLQQLFSTVGCSPRGDAYPTNTGVQAGSDKEWYNAQTWKQVKDKIQTIYNGQGVDCTGPITNPPSDPPTLRPTTLAPSPSPTLPPVSMTPAPIYAANAAMQVVLEATSASTAADAANACKALGYMRQYDGSLYVIELEMNGGVDYYTTAAGEEICELLADPVNGGTLMWSDRVDGPFMDVTVNGAHDFEILGTNKSPDGRVYSSWVSPGTGVTGGYGSTNPAGGIFTAAGGQAYVLRITTQRSHNECRERMSPLLVDTFGSPAFSPPCSRTGSQGQVWSDTAPMCDGGDNTALLYAIGNRQFGTCDSLCVFSPSYDGTAGSGDYWFWQAGAGNNCWKAPGDYHANEMQYCQVDGSQFANNGVAPQQWAHAQKENDRLCKERCDMENGWVYAEGSCYRVSTFSQYNNMAGTDNPTKGVDECNASLTSGTATLASVGSYDENSIAMTLCATTIECYFGGMQGFGQGSGTWADGTVVSWVNWDTNEQTERAKVGTDMAMLATGKWVMYQGQRSIGVLCETDANMDTAESFEDYAESCALLDAVAAAELAETNSFPSLNVAESGFTDAANPANLHIVIDVPKTMFNHKIGFENATNDEAEYSWEWSNSYWSVTGDDNNCANNYKFTGAIPWQVFNLGGAGGVERLATWEDGGIANSVTTSTAGTTNVASDQGELYYQFGSVVRISASQPLFTKIQQNGASRVKRESRMNRDVMVRVPFILRFQKTVTVTTDVNIVSTKYNYKTVAAIIQSIQHSTNYFTPPYAQIMMQIRTKSQYPYMFNKDATPTLHVHSIDVASTIATLSLEHLSNDMNCTFTNSDHMREGDICTQEWMFHIVPNDNVCYATGEYSIELTTKCFDGKDVCYLPEDSIGNPIDTVTFTFKVQTSKFCPVMADEVDLTGTLAITGRETFKPADEPTLEGPSTGQMYMQGETIHVFATTASTKAKIVNTEVIMVELEQSMTNLVQTGYNRVPFDINYENKVIWTKNDGAGRLATGTVVVDDGATVTRNIVLMEDAGVYKTGDDPCTTASCTFTETEAGFKLNLHSRAMPVNVDSFGTKTIKATLEVIYEAMPGSRRRRMLQSQPTFDMRASTSFGTEAWQPHSVPKGMGNAASMSLEITLSSRVDRSNALSFSQAVHAAIVQSLQAEAQGVMVYDEQVSIDQLYSGNKSIWTRPAQGQIASRRLLNTAQKLKIEFTFSNVRKQNAMLLSDMVANFDKQLRSPSSTLMNQPLFAGAVVHDVREISTSTYVPPSGNTALTSSAFVAVPSLFALLALLW
jgi:hypothetical protein